MPDRNSSSEVLSALPRRRPHRRSDKRAARHAAGGAVETASRAADTTPRAKPTPQAKPTPRAKPKPAATPTPATRRAPKRLSQPAQPAGTPPSPATRGSVPTTGADVVGTAVHAAAELAEIGLSAGARALRNAVARLPRP